MEWFGLHCMYAEDCDGDCLLWGKITQLMQTQIPGQKETSPDLGVFFSFSFLSVHTFSPLSLAVKESTSPKQF